MTAAGCSVVVPAHGRPGPLSRCLEALAALRAPPGGHEVIVVDDGSPEPLESVVERYRGRMAVRCVRQSNAGPAAARNRGAAGSTARWVAFTDDDCEPEPDWLVRLVEALERKPRAIAGGRTENALPDNPWSEASQELVAHLYEYYLPERRPGAFFTSNNLAVGREALLECGGFSERFRDAGGEDRELCERWRRRGGRLVPVPGAVVRHRHELGPLSFLDQHYRYGRGAWRLRRIRPEGESRGLEPPAFYVDLLRRPFRESGAAVAARSAAILAAAQAAGAAGWIASWLESVLGGLRGAGGGPP